MSDDLRTSVEPDITLNNHLGHLKILPAVQGVDPDGIDATPHQQWQALENIIVDTLLRNASTQPSYELT